MNTLSKTDAGKRHTNQEYKVQTSISILDLAAAKPPPTLRYTCVFEYVNKLLMDRFRAPGVWRLLVLSLPGIKAVSKCCQLQFGHKTWLEPYVLLTTINCWTWLLCVLTGVISQAEPSVAANRRGAAKRLTNVAKRNGKVKRTETKHDMLLRPIRCIFTW